ncbi:MAG: NAD(P)-dependent oxidoreductase [Bacteroidetes bacterium]|nr:NAD(P)-dependent oxidoreductase [Bacteroidota bacterium]
MIKSIVFGANGYIGRHLVYYLNQQNQTVISSDVSQKPIDQPTDTNYKSINITHLNEVSMLDFDVDYIYCFGGLTGTNVGFDKYQDFIEVNEIGLLNILTHHKNSNSKARIVFPSTRLVYKGQKDIFLTEEAPKEALTIYAQNKLSCEEYLNQYAINFNIDYTVFRICVPYGNVFDENFSYGTVGFFYNKAKNNENITLFGKGELRRTFTHIEDICFSIFETLKTPSSKNTVFNIGSNDNLSLLDVATLFATKFNISVDFTQWPEQALKVESGDTIFDDTKLRNTINYTYKNSISNWIENL